MELGDVIEIDCYEEGKWITRRLPLTAAEHLYQQLGQVLGVHERPLSSVSQEDRLKLFVD